MAGPRYPLEPVKRLRDHGVAQATADLAAIVRARENAERDRADAEERRAAHRAEAEHVLEHERRALEQGALRAVDLAAARAWQAGIEMEEARLAALAEEAAARVRSGLDAEASAQRTLGARRADAEAVDRDRARWGARLAKKAEVREEEASLETWRPPR